MDPAGLAEAGELAAELVRRGELPAAGMAVARRGRLLWAGAWGLARREPALPAERGTLFAVASITKPLAATALLSLVEAGALGLDGAVADVLPEFAAGGKGAVTFRHLLTHTAGLDDARMPRPPAPSPEEHLARILALPLASPPGVRYCYCNAGYRLLGEVIRRLSGEPHQRFIANRLLAPLAMEDSHLGPPPTLLARVVAVERAHAHLLPALCDSASTAGGLFAPLVDLLKLGQLFLDGGLASGGRLLGEETVRAMVSDQAGGARDALGGAVAQGLGWMLRPRQRFSALASAQAFAHPGATGCWLVVEPARDLVFAFVANRWGWSGYGRRRVLDAVIAACDGR